MELFTKDLFRNFAIGFLGGAMALAFTTGGGALAFIPQAIAATMG